MKGKVIRFQRAISAGNSSHFFYFGTSHYSKELRVHKKARTCGYNVKNNLKANKQTNIVLISCLPYLSPWITTVINNDQSWNVLFQRKFQFDKTSCAGVKAVCTGRYLPLLTCTKLSSGLPSLLLLLFFSQYSFQLLSSVLPPLSRLPPPFSYILVFFPLWTATVPVLFFLLNAPLLINIKFWWD